MTIRSFRVLAVLVVIMGGLIAPVAVPAQPRQNAPLADLVPQVASTIYIPSVFHQRVWDSPFGIEVGTTISSTMFLQRAGELKAQWVRLNMVNWRQLQPNAGDPYNWVALGAFESRLRTINQLGLTAIVIVDDYPRWATIQPNACSPLRPDRYADFAAMMTALVNRYKAPPYNVRYWELGNEPDVDPDLIPVDSIFGCWGNIGSEENPSPYYGGRAYGEMVKVVGAAIKQADAYAKVLIGGLLLDTYDTTNPNLGKPEKFLEGILLAGAAPYFDIVPYHGHSSYAGQRLDYSGPQGGGWTVYGGPAIGKPTFLREIMTRYGVNKPLFFNEASLGCPLEMGISCDPPSSGFFEAQADHVARMMVRTLSAQVTNIDWYTLEGPSWRNGGLLDASQAPRPAFRAYQNLITRLRDTNLPPSAVSYLTGIEAYRFAKATQVVDVLWVVDGRATQPIRVTVPQAKFIAAYSRDGTTMPTTIANGNVQLNIDFSAVYIVRLP